MTFDLQIEANDKQASDADIKKKELSECLWVTCLKSNDVSSEFIITLLIHQAFPMMPCA